MLFELSPSHVENRDLKKDRRDSYLAIPDRRDVILQFQTGATETWQLKTGASEKRIKRRDFRKDWSGAT